MYQDKILIADPDSTTRSASRTLFEDAGFTVVEAEDGESALQLAKRSEVALVVAELYLPTSDDACLVHALRHSSALQRTRVLALTTHSRRKDRTWALRAGADAYVLKRSGNDRLMEVAGRLVRYTPARTKKLRAARLKG